MDLLLRDSTSTASPLLDALSAKCDYYGCETAHDVKTVVQAWVYIVIAVVVVGVAVGIIISACCFCKSCPLYKSMHKPAPPAPPAPRILTPVYVTQGNQYGGHVYHQGELVALALYRSSPRDNRSPSSTTAMHPLTALKARSPLLKERLRQFEAFDVKGDSSKEKKQIVRGKQKKKKTELFFIHVSKMRMTNKNKCLHSHC
ncbi:hypothetical protein C0J52_09124 [Blattella germanica]|nr:hypothetical protein C0J52_09124 [Blattella germanica]